MILGIDPGFERLGWGVLKKEGSRLQCLGCGLVSTPRIAIPDRLRMIEDGVSEIIETHRPALLVTERQLFAANKTTALDVAKALGVVLLVGSKSGLEWREFTPPEVKKAVVGVGNADKRQVQFMVCKLLGLSETPKPDDVADALAIAICGAFHAPLDLKK